MLLIFQILQRKQLKNKLFSFKSLNHLIEKKLLEKIFIFQIEKLSFMIELD